MKVMYISRRFKGCVCATMHLEALRGLYGDVFVVDLEKHDGESSQNRLSFRRPGKMMRAVNLLRGCGANVGPKEIGAICRKIREGGFTHVFVDESGFGCIVRAIKRNCPGVRVAAFFHDIDRATYPERLRVQGLSFLPTCLSVCHGERLTVRHADKTLVLNERDAALYRRYYGKAPNVLLPMSVEAPDLADRDAPEYAFRQDGTRHLLLVAAYYYPNLHGLRWFVDHVFSRLPENVRLVVIGRGMEKVRGEYAAHERIDIVGGVEKLAPYYNQADVVVAPVLGGGGMKQKTAEALAYGKPIVCTLESLTGYEAPLAAHMNQTVFASDDADDQLQALTSLLAQPGQYHPELNEVYRSHYAVDVTRRILASVLADR